MRASFLFCMLVSFFLLIGPEGALSAADPVGSVVAVRGEAVAFSVDGTKRSLAIKSAVYLKDTLKTGERGRLQVLFNDATIISMGPGSQMTVAAYEWNGEAGNIESQVKEGFFHIMGGNIAKKSPEHFTTQTPIATIGIRGSTFALSLIDDMLSVVFIGGTGIHVFNDAGAVEIIRPGFGTHLTPKADKPSKPKRFSEKELGGILKHTKPEREASQKKRQPGVLEKKRPLPPQLPIRLPEVEDKVDPTRPPKPPEPSEPEPTPTVYNFTGQYMTMLSDTDETVFRFGRFSTGTLAGKSQTGQVAAQGVSDDGLSFSFDFDMPEVNLGGEYDIPFLEQRPLQAFPLSGFSSDTLFNADRYASPLGEFAILTIPKELVVHDQDTLAYSMLGYLGIPALQANRPGDVIYDYFGPTLWVMQRFDNDEFDGVAGWMSMRVNWHNNRFIGFIDSGSDDGKGNVLAPFFGTIKADTPEVEQVVFLGNFDSPIVDAPEDDPDNFVPISWLTSDGEGFGRFFGSGYQGFGALTQGGIVDIESNQTDLTGEWHLGGAGFRSPVTEMSSHGSLFLAGFVIGVGENMTDPHLAPRFYMNRDASDFTMEIDRDAGTLSGTLAASDLLDAGHALSNIEIGGGLSSAYVDDDLYMALLGGDPAVSAGGGTGSLKPYGNHLQPTDPSVQLAEHTTWGYWEVAYDEPGTGIPYHVHVPGSMWIAGEQTPEEKIQEFVQAGHVGHYEGASIGVISAPNQPHLVALEGTVNMAIDFAPSSQAPLSGSFHFSEPDIHLIIENGAVGPSGFSGTFQSTLQSQLNGGLFGPNAEAAAGNFAVILDQERAISGIFGVNALE